MALGDFLYPHLEMHLILARALDVDEVQVGRGTLSREYQEVAARVFIATRDAQRLKLNDGEFVEVNSDIGSVVVVAKLKDNQPEGIVVMHPSPWAFAVIEAMMSSQGTKVIIKTSKGPITSIDKLP